MASRFHVPALCLAAWIGWSVSTPIGCAAGEEIDPNNFVPAGSGGKQETSGAAGSMQSLPAGGSSGTADPTTGSGGSSDTGGTGSGGSANSSDSGTPGTGGSSGQSGTGGTAGAGTGGAGPMDAAFIPPDAPLAMGINVLYKAGDTNNMNDTILFYLDIVNNGTTDVPLAALKVRYYFTDELNGAGNMSCYDSNTATYPGGMNYKGIVGSTTITRSTMPMVTGANAYLEITTSETAMLAAKSRWDLQCHHSSPGGQPQNESNDYSAILTQTAMAPTTKVVVMQGATVVAGMVPQ
jgi:hypothetical protein